MRAPIAEVAAEGDRDYSIHRYGEFLFATYHHEGEDLAGDLAAMAADPVVKEWWQPSRVDELPFVLHRAWNQMLSGRPGPVLLDLPMDVQADSAEVVMPDRDAREARGRTRPSSDDVERAAGLLRGARRPVPGTTLRPTGGRRPPRVS